jgi:hypothetical protein
MRLERSNIGARVCALALFVVLAVTAFTAAPAFALPEGRVYEMVSPPYKGGYDVREIDAVSQDGERVAFFSLGVFAGTPGNSTIAGYLASRGASGWATTSLVPPSALLTEVPFHDFSPTLESSLASGFPGPNNGASVLEGTEEAFLLHSTNTPDLPANWELAGVAKALDEKNFEPVVYAGASTDFCHILFEDGIPFVPAAGVGGGNRGELYDLTRGCGGGEPSLRLVGVNNKPEETMINPACAAELGSGGADYSTGATNTFHAVAADGGEIFFTTCVGASASPHQLFVRLSGSRTLEVSRPLDLGGCSAGGISGEVPCEGAASRPSASFAGANETGTAVFFTTSAPLLSGDKDETNNLYMATIGCPGGGSECEVSQREVTGLVRVSQDPVAGEAAEVQGPVRVAPDGSRAYFVARGVLSTGANAEGRSPAKGADNLYMYDRNSGTTEFVAALCSDAVRSGTVEDLQCPANLTPVILGRNDTGLWRVQNPEAQTAGPDGRYLVFSSYGQLATTDTDTARDVYRYDAVTGTLVRVSVGEAGYDANGNNSAFDAGIAPGALSGPLFEQYEMAQRAVSEDGSRIVFTTAEPLSPAASNGLLNAYEWHEGIVSLVSTGSDEQAVSHAVISPSGKDLFFITVQGLVPQDTDGSADIYDARLGGGFPPAPAPRQPCSGDACQGALTNPAPLLVPGSVSQSPGENFPPPQTTAPTSKAKARKKAKRKQKRAAHRRRRGKAAITGGATR